MKQSNAKRLIIAGIALLTVPFSLFAQKEDKDKVKDKKDMQQIIITRQGDKNEKMVVEIQGEKVLINGKDAKDNKDVNVNVNTLSPGSHVYVTGPGQWSTVTRARTSLFTEDENRAMLGVVTEGDDKGAEIRSVTKESGADKAGLKKGDILTRIGDKKIESTEDVTEAIHARKPGEKVTITFLRDGKEQKATAELGKWKGINLSNVTVPSLEGFRAMESPRGFSGTYYPSRPRLGLSVQDTDDGNGVKVTDVEDESNAAKAGLKEDDVIVGIDDKEIHSTDDVVKITKEAVNTKYTYVFKVKRNGKTENITVNVPRRLKTADL